MALDITTVLLVSIAAIQVAWSLPPTVDISPRTVIRTERDNLTVVCRVGLPIAYCRFFIPDMGGLNINPNVPEHQGVQYYGNGLEKGECGISLRNIRQNHNGVISCSIGFMSQAAESSANMTLIVAKAPSTPSLSVSKSKNPESYREGETIQAECIIENGRPVANISWYLGNEPIYEGLSPAEVQDSQQGGGLKTIKQNLIRKLRYTDHGKDLKCLAGHMAQGPGHINHTIYKFNIKFPPKPPSREIEQFGFNIGQPGRVVVTFYANPKPKITWQVDDERLEEGSRDRTGRFQSAVLYNGGYGAWNASLNIYQVTTPDVEKRYILYASNDLGRESYRVAISTSPEPPADITAGAIVGIVFAVLIIALVVCILIYARATGRWCFAGGVAARQAGESKKHFNWPKRNTETAKSLTYKDYKLVATEGGNLYVAPDEEQLLLAKKKYVGDVTFVNEVAGTSTSADPRDGSVTAGTADQDSPKVHNTVGDLRHDDSEPNPVVDENKRHTFPFDSKPYEVLGLADEGLNVPPHLLVGKNQERADIQVRTLPTKSKSKLVADWLKGNKPQPKRNSDEPDTLKRESKPPVDKEPEAKEDTSSSSSSSDEEEATNKPKEEKNKTNEDEKKKNYLQSLFGKKANEDVSTLKEPDTAKRQPLARVFSRQAKQEKPPTEDAQLDAKNRDSRRYFPKWFSKSKDSSDSDVESENEDKNSDQLQKSKKHRKKTRREKKTSGSEGDSEESSADEAGTKRKKRRTPKNFMSFLGKPPSKVHEGNLAPTPEERSTVLVMEEEPKPDVAGSTEQPKQGNYFAKLLNRPATNKETAVKSDNEVENRKGEKRLRDFFKPKKESKSEGDMTVASGSDDEAGLMVKKPKKQSRLMGMLSRKEPTAAEGTDDNEQNEDKKNAKKYKFWKPQRAEKKDNVTSTSSSDSSSETDNPKSPKKKNIFAKFGKKKNMDKENQDNDPNTGDEDKEPKDTRILQPSEQDNMNTVESPLQDDSNIHDNLQKTDQPEILDGKETNQTLPPKSGKLGVLGKLMSDLKHGKPKAEVNDETIPAPKSALVEQEKKHAAKRPATLFGLFGSNKQLQSDKEETSDSDSDYNKDQEKKNKKSKNLFGLFDKKKPNSGVQIEYLLPEPEVDGAQKAAPKTPTPESEDQVDEGKVEWSDVQPEFHYKEAKPAQNEGNILNIFGSRNSTRSSKLEEKEDRDERMPSDNKKHYASALKKLWGKKEEPEEDKEEEETKEMEQKESSLEAMAADENLPKDEIILNEESSPEDDRKKKVGSSLKKWLAKKDGKVLPDRESKVQEEDGNPLRPTSIIVGSWGPKSKREGSKKTPEKEEARKSWHTLAGENYVSASSGDDEKSKKKRSRPVSFAEPVVVPADTSDTESADHGSADKSSVSKLTSEKSSKKPKLAGFLDLLKSKSRDKVADNEAARGMPLESDKEPIEDHYPEDEDKKEGVVYAELDLGRGQTNIMRSKDDDKTEYAEIIHPDKADKKNKEELRKSRENLSGSREVLNEPEDVSTTPNGKKEAAV